MEFSDGSGELGLDALAHKKYDTVSNRCTRRREGERRRNEAAGSMELTGRRASRRQRWRHSEDELEQPGGSRLGFFRGNKRGGAGLLVGRPEGNKSRDLSSDFGKEPGSNFGREFQMEVEEE